MQTFSQYKNYYQYAKILYNKRLNKQILKSCQILKGLSVKSLFGAWPSHQGYLHVQNFKKSLRIYIKVVIKEPMVCGIKTDMNRVQ